MRLLLLILTCCISCGGAFDTGSDLATDAADAGDAHDAGTDASETAEVETGAGGLGWGGSAGAAGSAGAGGSDAAPAQEGGEDAPVVVCPSDQHACGGTCVADVPEKGCGVQCSACVTPDWSASVCNAASECDFECLPWCQRVGAGCSCPGKPECCSSDECVAPLLCFDGRCRGQFACDPGSCWQFCVRCVGKAGAHCEWDGCKCDEAP